MFVSRKRHEAIVAHLEERVNTERERAAAGSVRDAQRYDDAVKFLQDRCADYVMRYEKQVRFNRMLVKQIVALKKEGFTAPRATEQPVPTAPTNDVDLVRETQRRMAVDAAEADLVAEGLAPAQAKAEAQRMIDSLFAPIAGDFQ